MNDNVRRIQNPVPPMTDSLGSAWSQPDAETFQFFEEVSGGESALEYNDGNIVKAYFEFIAPKLIFDSKDWTVRGVIDEFRKTEGYLPIDGSYGVTLKRLNRWFFDREDFEFKYYDN